MVVVALFKTLSCAELGVGCGSPWTAKSCLLFKMILNTLKCRVLGMEIRALVDTSHLSAPSLRAHLCQALF